MKNNAKIDDAILENFEEVLSIGLNSSADIFSKLLNSEVKFDINEIISENIGGLESFGDNAGVIVALNIKGALQGKSAVVIQNGYAKDILNILMNVDNVNDEDDDFDEIAMGTFKELIDQMAAAFAEALTTFFGVSVQIEAYEIHDISEECDEIAEIFNSSIDSKIYTVINKFEIENQLIGDFNIEIDQDTFDFLLNKLNITAKSDDESLYHNVIDSGNDNMNMQSVAESRRTSGPVSVMKDSINVQSAKFPSFTNQGNIGGISLLQGNMDLLMDVPLNVTIEIGKTRKKMRDIMEFTQGTVIDLEKQAGAPVDIVVNGQLIARGDVVVIDDNFGVRVTEIIGNNSFIAKE